MRGRGRQHKVALWGVGWLGLLCMAWGMVSCHDHDHDHDKKGSHKKDKEHDHKKHGEKGHKEDDHKKHGEHGHEGHMGEVVLRKEARKQVRLKFFKVGLRDVGVREIAVVGRVALPPSELSQVGSQVEGRIVRWYVRLGQKVRRGQALALLECPAVGRTRATYLRRLALHRLAATEYKRARRLKRLGLASAKQLLAARIASQRASIALQGAGAQLRILGISVPKDAKLETLTGRFVLRAPRSGEVTSISHTLGAWVRPQTTILRVEARKKLWVLLEVYARDVPYVHVGQRVHLYGPGIHAHLQGVISYLASRFERGAQTLEARVAIDNTQEKLRPNQFVYALIKGPRASASSGKKRKALLIPEDAVQRIGRGRRVVFVVGDAPGHFEVRTLVGVEAPGGMVRVLYGLRAGERVVVDGSFVLKSELLRASLAGGHGHAH